MMTVHSYLRPISTQTFTTPDMIPLRNRFYQQSHLTTLKGLQQFSSLEMVTKTCTQTATFSGILFLRFFETHYNTDFLSETFVALPCQDIVIALHKINFVGKS